jgi:hypothetical protein
VRVLAVTPAGRDRASTRTPSSGRGLQRRLGRSTGHPGRASTTPEMSVTGPDGRAEPVPAGRTPHEALTKTRAGSNHRACGPNHRIVTVTAAWTVRWADRFRRRGGRVLLAAGAPGGLDHSGGSPPSRPGRGHGADESGDHQLDSSHLATLALAAVQGLDRLRNHSAEHDSAQPSARQEFALSNALVCRSPPKARKSGAAGTCHAPVPRMPHLAVARGVRHPLVAADCVMG